jgi:S1-C subfamily serine protease
VAGAAELSGIMAEHKPGERVDVTVIRDGTPIDVAVTLGTRSAA